MSIVSVTYKRSLLPATKLDSGEWSLETASGRVGLCCKTCGQIYELDEFHRVDPGGLVVPAVRCDNDACLAFGYIKLADYDEPVVST